VIGFLKKQAIANRLVMGPFGHWLLITGHYQRSLHFGSSHERAHLSNRVQQIQLGRPDIALSLLTKFFC
jgi:hypothetical protein